MATYSVLGLAGTDVVRLICGVAHVPGQRNCNNYRLRKTLLLRMWNGMKNTLTECTAGRRVGGCGFHCASRETRASTTQRVAHYR